MKKNKYWLLLIFVAILIGIGILVIKKQGSVKQYNVNPYLNIQDSAHSLKKIKVTNELKWKTYSNNKLGFTFQYPSSWVKEGKDIKVTDLSGNVTIIELYFEDTILKTNLLIKYHFPPNAEAIYRYVCSQYKTSKGWYSNGRNQIKVDGIDAFEAVTNLNKDGKGHIINPPIRLIVIDFFEIKRKVEIELQFKTQLVDDNIEINKLKQLLSTFKILKMN